MSRGQRCYLSTLGDQPAGRLDTEGHAEEEDNCWYELHRDWNHPPLLRELVGVCTAHPCAPDAAEMNKDLNIAGKEAAESSRGKLSLVRRDEWLDDAHG